MYGELMKTILLRIPVAAGTGRCIKSVSVHVCIACLCVSWDSCNPSTCRLSTWVMAYTQHECLHQCTRVQVEVLWCGALHMPALSCVLFVCAQDALSRLLFYLEPPSSEDASSRCLPNILWNKDWAASVLLDAVAYSPALNTYVHCDTKCYQCGFRPGPRILV